MKKTSASKTSRTLSSTVLLACGVLAICTITPAWAHPMRTALTTYMRVGPGLQFAVIDELDRHATVDVQDCQNGWCRIVFGTRAGYVRADHMMTDTKPAASDDHASVACFNSLQSGYDGGDEYRFCGR